MNRIIKTIFLHYLNLIKKIKYWFFTIVLVFLIAFVLGSLVSLANQQFSAELIRNYASSLDLEQKSGLELSFYIYQRNLTIVSIGTLAGFLAGLSTVLVVFINGFLLGVILSFKEIYNSISPYQLLLLLLPHGILEYLASFLAMAYGLRLGLNWIFTKESSRYKTFLQNFRETLGILVLVAFLLLIAALIEGLLTERIACWLGGLCK